jgi:hypothetical protein
MCETCHIWRPPKASHCSICNYCVKGFDHRNLLFIRLPCNWQLHWNKDLAQLLLSPPLQLCLLDPRFSHVSYPNIPLIHRIALTIHLPLNPVNNSSELFPLRNCSLHLPNPPLNQIPAFLLSRTSCRRLLSNRKLSPSHPFLPNTAFRCSHDRNTNMGYCLCRLQFAQSHFQCYKDENWKRNRLHLIIPNTIKNQFTSISWFLISFTKYYTVFNL